MNLFEFGEWEKTLIGTMIGTVTGFFASFVIEWYKKIKNPRVLDADLSSQLTIAAKENVATTQTIVDILEGRLLKEREYYDTLIERSKLECTNQILRMKADHDEEISKLKSAHEKQTDDLQVKIITWTAENAELNRQVVNLTNDKNVLQGKVIDLQVRLQRYENNLNAQSSASNGLDE